MKNIKASDIELVPFSKLQSAVSEVLKTSKKQSDLQLKELQAANVKKRAAKKKAA